MAQVRNDKPTCLRLLVQLTRCALALARASAGSSKAAKMAIMAITTNNSMRVKAPIILRRFFITILLVSVLFWQTDRELYQCRPRCQPESTISLAMAVPPVVFEENLRNMHVA